MTGRPGTALHRSGRALEGRLGGAYVPFSAGQLAYRLAARVDVPEVFRVGVAPPRAGYCYEQGLDYALRLAGYGVVLVHGLVHERAAGVDWPLDHCWVEHPVEQVIFDPSSSKHYEPASYYEVMAALPLRKYTPGEVAERLAGTGWRGPWADSIVVHRAVCRAAIEAVEEAAPGLHEWVRAMLHVDPVFRAQVADQLRPGTLALVRVYLFLAADGRWRDHEPGRRPWPWPVHPVGRPPPDHPPM